VTVDEPAATDQPRPLTTKTGWSQFAQDTEVLPTLLPDDRWQALGADERDHYDEIRLRHHARLVTITTPLVNDVIRLGRRLSLLNRDQVTARRGLIISGRPATGKSTAIIQLGKHHEIRARRQRGDQAGPFLPVIYVTIPPAATPRIVAAEFARFLGLPLTTRMTQVAITNAVCDLLARLGCQLVLVDEVHNISLETRYGAESSDQLKYLAERMSATFVYAGINLEREGLFVGTRGEQIAGRFISITTAPFGNNTPSERQNWAALVAGLEHTLLLHRSQPGMLLQHADYLHDRTGGLIGSLSHLIRSAALDAILDGTETITKATLDAVTIDHHAEEQHRAARRRRRTRTTPAP
jgi:Bacterial TniB protein